MIVSGSRGVVGTPLCQRLAEQGVDYKAVSRSRKANIVWDMETPSSPAVQEKLKSADTLVHCAPIWLLPPHLETMQQAGIHRLIVFSSTSVLSKQQSSNPQEQKLVKQLAESEAALKTFCETHNMRLTIFRPSMIYGYGMDENVTRIAKFIHRYSIAILAGKGAGLRQPVHADDLVDAVMSVLAMPRNSMQVYNLAGAEVLSYRQMVERIFSALGKKPKIVSLPVPLVRFALRAAAFVTHFSYTAEMADRMNQDLIYDTAQASSDFGFTPKPFLQSPARDLPGLINKS